MVLLHFYEPLAEYRILNGELFSSGLSGYSILLWISLLLSRSLVNLIFIPFGLLSFFSPEYFSSIITVGKIFPLYLFSFPRFPVISVFTFLLYLLRFFLFSLYIFLQLNFSSIFRSISKVAYYLISI